MKINYLCKWDDEGCHYNQTVTVVLTAEQISAINEEVKQLWYFKYSHKQLLCRPGLNFTTISSARIIAKHSGAAKNKRYKTDRNTVFVVIPA